jgi:chorismate mutase/prephenate dehydratase
MPHALLKDVSSTATAAELAQREPGAAAVASHQAAVRYGLRVLFAQIEDSPHNETRFAVIGHQKAARTGNDKTAIMFRVPHNPGSLVEALDIFKQNKINLTWIESFPARTAKPEYIFFADFEGHQEDTRVHRALKALGEHSLEVTVLGSFPAATTVA